MSGFRDAGQEYIHAQWEEYFVKVNQEGMNLEEINWVVGDLEVVNQKVGIWEVVNLVVVNPNPGNQKEVNQEAVNLDLVHLEAVSKVVRWVMTDYSSICLHTTEAI